jgi:hypothetical protein
LPSFQCTAKIDEQQRGGDELGDRRRGEAGVHDDPVGELVLSASRVDAGGDRDRDRDDERQQRELARSSERREDQVHHRLAALVRVAEVEREHV